MQPTETCAIVSFSFVKNWVKLRTSRKPCALL
jgi:hypothetical protein